MDKKVLLSTLWIFLTVNYIFCDVFSLFYAPDLKQFLSGYAGDIALTQSFLLAFAIIMEMAMLMIVLSRVLPYALNRWFNIIGGILFTIVQAGSLADGNVTQHYLFFSVIEISTTLLITYLAWNWTIEEKAAA
jgi:hypothetical protein